MVFETQLFLAVKNRDIVDVKKQLQNGVDVNARDENGETPLHEAAINNECEIAEILIKHGAEVNAQNNNGLSALHYAAMSGLKEMSKILVEHGADVFLKDKTGDGPLIYIGQNARGCPSEGNMATYQYLMNVALDKEGRRTKRKYYCPYCSSPLTLEAGNCTCDYCGYSQT
jgi:hypothetical protein